MVDTFKAAVVQAAPVLFDLEETLEKTLVLIDNAANKGAKLIVFPESFIPCYPRGLTFGMNIGSRSEEGRDDFLRYYKNSVAVPGPVVDRLAEAAKEYGVYLSIGVTEKDGHGLDATLHCSNLFFGPDGYLGRHRKIKPTASERTIWGEDDGSTLTVFDTAIGKMGALICWENYMPLARMALYEKGIELYLVPTADQRDIYQSTMQHIAFEGRCFVFMANQYVEKSMYPTDLKGYDELEDAADIMCRGGSCIIDPFGNYLAGPAFGEETIIIANIDMDEIIRAKMDFDPIGHYQRPDLFEFKVNN